VSFHFGLPDDELLSRVKGWGTKVLSSATTVKEALWLEAKGVDAVIAQGVEAGGHRGMFLTDDVTTQLGLFSLLPQLTARLNIPVIAAGGIANPSGVASALSMGASAVQIGTTYLLCPEANTTPLHRHALKSEAAQHTALTNIFSGRPARGIVNRVMRELGYITPDAPSFPYAGIEITQLKLAAEAVNSTDFTSLWCGQNASGCQEISAYELTRWLTGAA
jgi:nitronate monooxygenase